MDSATVSAIASSYANSAASGKLDATAFNSGDFYSTSNPSGFITGVDLTPYQEKTGMSAYQPTGDYAYNSSLAGYIPTSESGNYQQVTGMTAYIPTSESGNYQLTAGMTAYQPAGNYQTAGDYIYASSLGIMEI